MRPRASWRKHSSTKRVIRRWTGLTLPRPAGWRRRQPIRSLFQPTPGTIQPGGHCRKLRRGWRSAIDQVASPLRCPIPSQRRFRTGTFTDRQNFELYPIVPATAPTAVVAATNVSARSATCRRASIPNLPASAWFVYGTGGGSSATTIQINTNRQPYTLAVPVYIYFPRPPINFTSWPATGWAGLPEAL